jgi:hypothetical protein
VYIGARRHEPVGHPAQRFAIDELVVIDRGDGPAASSRDRNTAVAERPPGTLATQNAPHMAETWRHGPSLRQGGTEEASGSTAEARPEARVN